jgi:hypothetical protein
VVALSEGNHNNEQAHAFRLSLIRDPRFSSAVTDIVVEFGSARYQDLIDRFISGNAVTDEALRRVWQNTTAAQAIWDVPIYEEFFRAVRAVNASLPRDRQLRVLLGDPPIDWDAIHSKDDLARQLKQLDRDQHTVDLIRREVLSKRRRALVIYGDGHLSRKDVLLNFAPSSFLLARLEASGPKAFSIWTETNIDLSALQPGVVRWPRPSLAVLRGTILGAADFSSYLSPEPPRFPIVGNGPDFSSPLPRSQYRSLPMEDQFDALLYFCPSSEITMSRLSAARCTDRVYLSMRLERMEFAGMQRLIDRLKQYCDSVVPR